MSQQESCLCYQKYAAYPDMKKIQCAYSDNEIKTVRQQIHIPMSICNFYEFSLRLFPTGLVSTVPQKIFNEFQRYLITEILTAKRK